MGAEVGPGGGGGPDMRCCGMSCKLGGTVPIRIGGGPFMCGGGRTFIPGGGYIGAP